MRIVQVEDSSSPDEYAYRQLVSRTGPGGQLLEEPFAFASDPSAPLYGVLACDGAGGFVVLWNEARENCLRARAFSQNGSPSSDEQLLRPECTHHDERPVQFEHSDAGEYRVLWQSRSLRTDVYRDRILFRRLDENTLGSHPVVPLKRLRATEGHPWEDRSARMDDEQTALIVWTRNFKVKGQLIGLDGEPDTDVFRLSLSHESPATLEPIVDTGDGFMVARWNSFWQAQPIGRRVAVSVPIPELPTTTTTTLPDDPAVPLFERANRLQGLRDDAGSQWAYPPTIAADSDGNAIAVWTHRTEGEPISLSYAVFRATTRRWGKRRDLPQDHSTTRSYRPRIVSIGDGTWMAMWIQSTPTGCGLATTKSVDLGESWSSPRVAVEHYFFGEPNPSACWISDFDLSADRDGVLVAAWPDRSGPGENSDPVLRVSRSVDRGVTWSDAFTALTMDDEAWRGFALAPGGDGKWGIVWATNFYTSYHDRTETGGQIFFSASSDSAASWSPPIAIAGSPGQSPGQPMVFSPQIASDLAGTWLVAWASQDDLTGSAADWDIFVSRSSDAGATWTNAARVADYAADDFSTDFAPSLATDERGRWMIAWESSFTVPGASGLDDDILVASSDDAGATWTTPVAIDRNADSDERLDAGADLASGGAGRWFSTWTARTDVPHKLGVGVFGAWFQNP